MCGISFSKIKFNLKKINLEKTLSDIDKYINQKKFPEALILLKELKCNNFFVNILDKASNKSILKKKLNLFLTKIKSDTLSLQKNIDFKNDIIWLIESELLFKSKKILNFIKLNKIKKDHNSIIFTRYLLYTLETMNYLESRGRDSLGLTINIFNKKSLNIRQNVKNNYNLIFFQKKIKNNKFLISFTLKFAKRIGYSGENVSNILK